MPNFSTTNSLAAIASSRQLRVLLVDDDEIFRHALADNLREDGHVVFEYAAPSEVSLSAVGEVNVIVTDFDLPGDDGVNFADGVHAARPGLPIVVLTANPEARRRVNAAAGSCLYLVEKPVDYQRLRQLLQALAAAAHG